MGAANPNGYRMRPEAVVYAFFGVCFIALGIVGAAESISAGLVTFALLRLAVAWSIAAFLGFRMARLGVFVEEHGIRVRNPLKTKRIPWSEVRGFVLRRSLLGEFGIAELHSGGSVRLWGIQPRSRVASSRDRRAELAIGSLNRDLQIARGYGSLSLGTSRPPTHLAPGTPSAERT